MADFLGDLAGAPLGITAPAVARSAVALRVRFHTPLAPPAAIPG